MYVCASMISPPGLNNSRRIITPSTTPTKKNDRPSIVSSDELAVIRLQPPSYQTDFSIPADVRYWSMNIGDNKTLNYNGIKDSDAIVADDGWTYFVFGRDNNDVKAKCDEIKYNFVEWKMPTDRSWGITLYFRKRRH